MELSQGEKAILQGDRGEILSKVMRTLVLYGEAVQADRFASIEGPGHFSCPFCIPGVGVRLEILNELVEAGLKIEKGFTLDPRAPLDFENLFLTQEQKTAFKNIFGSQAEYDQRMIDLGLVSDKAYTCTPYFEEVGNIPKYGEILAWSESSCVVYANSVLGARTNRNAAMLDILSNIAGRTPLTGFLTDAGRRADWLIEVKTEKLPDPKLLGAAIGMKVMNHVPYIVGLERFLTPVSDPMSIHPETRDYLKEMGAACAAIGAVGLYHMQGITVEAMEQSKSLLKPDYNIFVVDENYLVDMVAAYKILWNDPKEHPQKCLIGCPHLSFRELVLWSRKIGRALKKQNRERVCIPTVLCAAPQVIERFKSESNHDYNRLLQAGTNLSGTCAEAYMGNPLCSSESVITNSNKLRAFTPARMFSDNEIVQVIATGRIPGGA